MSSKIKVTLEYWAHFKSGDSQDYKVTKITGAPIVEVGAGPNHYLITRVGDMITEEQAAELAKRVEVTTVGKANK